MDPRAEVYLGLGRTRPAQASVSSTVGWEAWQDGDSDAMRSEQVRVLRTKGTVFTVTEERQGQEQQESQGNLAVLPQSHTDQYNVTFLTDTEAQTREEACETCAQMRR